MLCYDVFGLILRSCNPRDVLCTYQFVNKNFHELVHKYGYLSLPKISDGLLIGKENQLFMLLPYYWQKEILKGFKMELVHEPLSIMESKVKSNRMHMLMTREARIIEIVDTPNHSHMAVRDNKIIALLDHIFLDLSYSTKGSIPIKIWHKWAQVRKRKNTFCVGIVGGNRPKLIASIEDLKEGMCLHTITAPFNVIYNEGIEIYIFKLAIAEHFLEQHQRLLRNEKENPFLTNLRCSYRQPNIIKMNEKEYTQCSINTRKESENL